ncbi:MAG: aminopeptidase [Clostridia bacterium]|nr:aminopeptidase [Clostridia bacterium]
MDLSYSTRNAWETYDSSQKEAVFSFSDGYKSFLNNAKTERLATSEALKIAKDYGFCDITEKDTLKSGDKVYLINRNKSVLFATIGKEDITSGINFVISHIDAPRIDIKQNPLYEDCDMALFKTHYYGGIKKYQWTALPLALYGIVFLKDGSKIDVSIGDNENDPVFCISDLLPHLADKQMQQKMFEAFKGETLNIIVGSTPDADSEKDKFKTSILKILNEKYKMSEEDFISAELEAVPALKASDVGLDRSIVGSYAHDDRICAYTSLRAFLETKEPQKTAVCMLVDKEEIGSMGNSGMRSAFFEFALATIISKMTNGYNELMLKTTLRNSSCLSADVSAAVDPYYQDVSEKQNAAILGHGIVITKYTGSRGKSGTSDANAEFVFKVRDIFNKANIIWQSAELGKTDAGGGGTIAQYVANLDVDVLDCGVSLLSMHAPFELASKADIYEAYKAYKAFYEQCK